MKVSDIRHLEARAWALGFMSMYDIDRGGDGREPDYEIDWHLEDLIDEVCPHPTPELTTCDREAE